MHKRASVLWLCPVLLCLLCGDARAHKIKLFATGEGRAIAGYVYFPGGGRARGVTVQALAPDGSPLGQATTDADGAFSLAAKFRCDHQLVVQTADGHRATFRVEASELSAELPAYGGAAPATRAEPSAKAPGTSVAAPPADELAAMVEEAVRKQVRPLREQLEGYEERRRLHDIIGGIGYIVGVAGIAFYFLGARRRGAARENGPRG